MYARAADEGRSRRELLEEGARVLASAAAVVVESTVASAEAQQQRGTILVTGASSGIGQVPNT